MKATETTVLNFIGGLDKVFIIPPFQRNYEWSEPECRALFDDIIISAQTAKKHYLGNVVYYVGENNGASYSEYILVDGQQRITSILLLLCALRDHFQSIGDNSDADSINRRYLKNDTSDNRFRVRLKQTAYDAQCFMSIIDKTPCSDTDNKIIKNYQLFSKLIKESTVAPKDIYESIPKLEIVDVNLQIENDLSTVQTVFEKINSTGKPLTPADLIRNYLLLAHSSNEQERLYQNYWLKIERTVGNDFISRFARDYLIMNIFEDVPNDSIYRKFKGYFEENKMPHISILMSMCEYADYFAWIKSNKCPNEKINRSITYLNYLKTDDLYPLYLFLFKSLYSTNQQELLNILNLLVDFMLRYRIVSPSGGGGALRSAIQQLLEGLSDGSIELTRDSILFELSNSPTPASRFPDDEEFKRVLMDSVNTTYARILLLKIEEAESRNIPVDFSKVTIEHLMPQTLTDWWINYLGGEEEASRIYDTYLNCIGNLAPISQGYNSQNSNKPWDIKLKNLKDVQFNVTSEIASIATWNEADIKKRNKALAERSCKAITSPLERTRKFQTKNASDECVPGLYMLSDISTPMSGANIESLVYNNEIISISTWKEFFNKVCLISFHFDSEKFKKIVAENIIHKATSTKNYPQKDPVITSEPSKLVLPQIIEGTVYYTEGALSSTRARIYAKQLVDLLEITNRFQLAIQ